MSSVSNTDAYKVDISNLDACVIDAASTPFEADPTLGVNIHSYYELIGVLRSDAVQRDSFPGVYKIGVVDPFLSFVENLGPADYNRIMTTEPKFLNPTETFLHDIMRDISHAILQCAFGYAEHASDAFQEMVSDLYDGYVGDAERASISPPDHGTLPPLVKWGGAENGPYTWTIRATSQLGLKVAIVSLPPGNASHGLCAWSTLGHETGGHDVMHADTGLEDELGNAIYNAVLNKYGSTAFAQYWKGCVGEAGSDVFGLLNMGPAAAMGLIAYFRGLGGGTLSTVGALQGPHPVDVLRGIIAATVVNELALTSKKEWAKTIEDEALRHLGNQNFTVIDKRTRTPYTIGQNIGIESARLVAKVILNTRLQSLENHAISEIQNWTDADHALSELIGGALRSNENMHEIFKSPSLFATHVVAGAVIEALKKDANVQEIFTRMKQHLVEMHQHNATWKGYIASHVQPASMHICPESIEFSTTFKESKVLI